MATVEKDNSSFETDLESILKLESEVYGVKITTLSYDPAKIRVDVAVHGNGEAQISVFKDRNKAAFGKTIVKENRASMEFDIPDAKLWSADNPELYQAEVKLICDGEECDCVTETFGIRTIEVNPEQGLLINGIQTFLRGGCIQ